MPEHDLDVVSLVSGLLFLGVAVLWGLSDPPGPPVDGWPLPALLIIVGVAGLLTSLGGRRRRRARTDAADPLD